MNSYGKLLDTINFFSQPFSRKNDYSSLLDKIGDARFVLIGEATHGTHEFYQTRIEITQELIKKKDFIAIGIEGDWPDAYLIHRYLQGADEVEDWKASLDGFKRFPKWMWRNQTIAAFIKWLRHYNDSLSSKKTKIGFYGLDLYSLFTSIDAVIHYLTKIDPKAATHARKRYACFDRANLDPQTYGRLVNLDSKKSCNKEVLEQLIDLQRNAFNYVNRDNHVNGDEFFYAIQNARLIKNAENYYRSLFASNALSWNIRDEHMAETLNILSDHLEKRFNKPAKIVVWAHNSHVGDARATEMSERGEINIGQLIREQYDSQCYSIGFSTYEGTVTAASDWGSPAECKQINPGIRGSYEKLFHDLHKNRFILDLHPAEIQHYLSPSRLQRAIGVVYEPETERISHYYFTRLPYQFDCIIHIDKTNAVEPLDFGRKWQNEKRLLKELHRL